MKMLNYTGLESLPLDASGLRLAKINKKEEFILCEAVIFYTGRLGVDLVLRRAAISGRVEIAGKIENHFADILDINGTILESVALDKKSYSALKNKWMRCRFDKSFEENGDHS